MEYSDLDQRLWLAAGKKVKEREYWLEKLAGELPRSIFPSSYEFKRIRADEESPEKGYRKANFAFDKDLSSALMKLSTGSDVRLFIVLTAVLVLLLSKYTGNDDIIVGSPILKPVTGKDKKNEDHKNKDIGLINKVIVLRTLLADHMSFRELVMQVRQTLVEADEHRNYPLEVLLKQLELPTFPFDVALLLDTIHDRQYLAGFEPGIVFSFTRTGSLVKGQVEYETSAYPSGTVERVVDHYHHLTGLVLDNANIKVSDVELLLPEEKKQLLIDFNSPAGQYPADKTIYELFAAQAAETPHYTAIVGPGFDTGTGLGVGAKHSELEQKGNASPLHPIHLTYRELNDAAGFLSAVLIEKGVCPGDIVAIMAERSIGMITGLLGILRAGAAYLPLNPKSPAARNDFLLRDCRVNLLLSTCSLKKEVEKFRGLEVEKVFIEEGRGEAFPFCSSSECFAPTCVRPSGKTVLPDDTESCVGARRAVPSASTCNLQPVTSPLHLAYIIYTSGSTGIPKGVPITHANFCPLMHWGYRYSGLGIRDRVIQNLSYYFDWSVWEIFITLTSGAALYMITEDILLNPEAEVNFILKNEITALHITPTQYEYLINVGKKLDTLKYLAIGAEKLTCELLQRSLESVNEDCRVFNMYGPTEATIMSAVLEIDRTKVNNYNVLSSVPIGGTIANTSLLVLDKHMKLIPIDVPGELYIAGDGLSQGYLNNPELTAEKFVRTVIRHSSLVISSSKLSPNDQCPMTNDLLYKTGDRVRWLPDGTVEFLGRLDYQVKIRGNRIEPGEIESHLLNHPGIKEALVVSKRYKSGENYLCAYIAVSSEEEDAPDAGQMREYLSAQLPAYMVPAYFVFLQRMPLNPNGKVDLKALPEPEVGSGGVPYAAPQDEIEEKLSKIWSEVLALASPPGIDDNFFELGGHSLRATTLVYNIYQTLGVNMEIEDVFSHPTIRELVLRLKELEESTYTAVIPVETKEYYRMSYAQRRLWVLCQFEADSTAYNMPLAVTFSGPLAVGAFTRAVQSLAERHESFRTLFVLIDGSPYQKIINKKDFEFRLEEDDLRSLNEQARQEETRSLYIEFANRAFDLEKGPLFCFKLVRLADEISVLMFNMHHIVNDGWSQGIITNEIITLYNTYRKNEKNTLPPLKLQYKDYTCWHNRLIENKGFVNSREYWLDRFKDTPNGVELPFDHPRQAIQTFNGGRVSFTLDEQRTLRLLEIGKEEDATLFMTLLTLVSVFLYRFSGQTDIIIGAPIANRKRPELSHIIGFLVNTLVYRNEIIPSRSFKQQLKSVKQTSLEGYQYQDYPFDLLVEELELERDLSQSPLFNIMIAHNNAETEDLRLAFEGLKLSGYQYSEEFNMSKFDLIFFMDEVDDGILTRIEYNSDLFEHSTIERMAANFLVFTDHVIAGSDGVLSGLPIISAPEYETVIHRFNDTDCDFPNLTLQEIFEKQVEKTPDKIAIVDPPERESLPVMITYRDLNCRINRLARFLAKDYKIKANDVVGVSMERSIEMIIVLLGIIKSGGAYLAVDPAYPRERVLHVLLNSQAGLLIIDKMRPELFADYPGKILDINLLADKTGLESSRNPRVVNRPTDVLYVNYTSGSTGTPNGAMLSHDCLTNLIQWQNEKTTIDCSLRVLQFTTISFCVSFQEIMGTLTRGGELHLIGEIERQDINYLMDFLADRRIEVLFLPFSYLNFLFNESSRWDRSFKHSLKHIITAGEQLKITAGLKRFLDLNTEIHLHNHYGSTEMHVVTSYTLQAATSAVTLIPPAGKPISNVKIFILDEHFNPVPIGVYGELFVAGRLEILGYVNNEELSRQKLISLTNLSGIKLYRSGDIGRWLPDGNIELRGRRDFMIKVRGFRVEPGEIESKILAIEKVRECVVVVKEDKSGQMHLVAYVSLDNIDAAEIRRILGNELPQYMIPKIVILDSLPLMPNGKVDREKLPEADLEVDEDRVIVPPGNEVEQNLVDIWSEILGTAGERISIDDNFFEIGGHSLKATTMMTRIHRELGVKVDLIEIFKTPTIGEIASLIRAIDWIKGQEIEEESGQQVKEIIL